MASLSSDTLQTAAAEIWFANGLGSTYVHMSKSRANEFVGSDRVLYSDVDDRSSERASSQLSVYCH